MKKILLTSLMGIFTLNLFAQTYNDGTWYSLYSTSTKTNTNALSRNFGEISGIFAPTDGTLSLQYKKYSFLSTDGTLYVYADGLKIGEQSKIDDYKNWKDKDFTIGENVSKISFRMEKGDGLEVRNCKISLAKHILLAEGTYGTTAYTEPFDFGSLQWGETAESVDEVALRSFLTNGNITISSSEPSVFRINSADNTEGVTYNVGANACASANGAAEQACAEGVLGDINLYGFKIYFCPQEAKEYNGTITITDGTNTATVAVKGTGLKKDQTITFAPETAILDSATIAPATVSGNLELTYTFAPEGIITWDGSKLAIAPISAPAQVTITASQEGNDNYNAATPVEQTITIYPSKTFGEDSAYVCPDDSVEYDGVNYYVGVYENVLLSVKNQYGSDSLVTFTVHALPTYLMEEEKTMYVGKDSTWREKDLSGYEIGEYLVYDSLQTVAGCDSVYQLTLKVIQGEDPTMLRETKNKHYIATKCLHNDRLIIYVDDKHYSVLGM